MIKLMVAEVKWFVQVHTVVKLKMNLTLFHINTWSLEMPCLEIILRNEGKITNSGYINPEGWKIKFRK